MANNDNKEIAVENQFDVAVFQNELITKKFGRFFIYKDVTETTMTVAEEAANNGTPTGTIILADYQTKGKGRKEGRSWEATAGKNLLFTMILRLPNAVDSLLMSVACPVSIAYACHQLGLNAWIKWPNDVWIGGKKVAGLLIDLKESVTHVGIGININQSFQDNNNEDLQAAGSLFDFLGKEVSRENFLASFCNHFENLITKTKKEVLNEYLNYEGLLGKNVVIMPKGKEDSERETGIAEKYDDNGFLCIKGKNQPLVAEEVSIRLNEPIDIKIFNHEDIGSLITGKWKNQLGSNVEFIAEENGVITGWYETAVGNAVNKHKLYGSWCEVIGNDFGALLGFSVAWTKRRHGSKVSLTSWTGRLYLSSMEIVTTWNLISSLPKKDEWKSVLTNKDVFHKLD